MTGLLLMSTTGWSYTAAENAKIQAFLEETFQQAVPKPQRLWVKADIKPAVQKILEPGMPKLSYRYWQANGKTVWLLDELGKERDITTAVVIKNQQVHAVKVVVYRESRGGEVQVPWFTDQFKGARHDTDWQREVDGISGATLSVRALKKQTELALYLSRQLS
jgi:hypothetical protein